MDKPSRFRALLRGWHHAPWYLEDWVIVLAGGLFVYLVVVLLSVLLGP